MAINPALKKAATSGGTISHNLRLDSSNWRFKSSSSVRTLSRRSPITATETINSSIFSPSDLRTIASFRQVFQQRMRPYLEQVSPKTNEMVAQIPRAQFARRKGGRHALRPGG